jgi:hypothetical protein
MSIAAKQAFSSSCYRWVKADGLESIFLCQQESIIHFGRKAAYQFFDHGPACA